MQASTLDIRNFILHPQHAAKNARFGAFGDWEVPLYYTSILEEHHAVRKAAGVFDISHMGEFFISGEKSAAFLNLILPRDILKMSHGQALYMPLLNEQAGILDDIIVYRHSDDQFLIIVNAANVEKDFAWIKSCAKVAYEKGITAQQLIIENRSDRLGLLAVQGPKSEAILKKAFGADVVSDLKYYHFKPWRSGVIARTGYTGEDGFEIMVANEDLKEVWDALFDADLGLVPVGFGCRDTLRLEAGMPLYGHDMTEKQTPFEARIDWATDLVKETFMGRQALVQAKENGIEQKRVGFELKDRGIPREGYEIQSHGQKMGVVTSGTFSPTLQKSIGMGYVKSSEASLGNKIDIVIRGKVNRAEIVKLPFYKRSNT